jgi:hypothetical protein
MEGMMRMRRMMGMMGMGMGVMGMGAMGGMGMGTTSTTRWVEAGWTGLDWTGLGHAVVGTTYTYTTLHGTDGLWTDGLGRGLVRVMRYEDGVLLDRERVGLRLTGLGGGGKGEEQRTLSLIQSVHPEEPSRKETRPGWRLNHLTAAGRTHDNTNPRTTPNPRHEL